MSTEAPPLSSSCEDGLGHERLGREGLGRAGVKGGSRMDVRR